MVNETPVFGEATTYPPSKTQTLHMEPSVIRIAGPTRAALQVLLVPGGEVESPRLAAAVFETATSTDSVTPAWDVAPLEHAMREARIIRQT